MRPTTIFPSVIFFLLLSSICLTVSANKKKEKKAPEWKKGSRPALNDFEETKHEGTPVMLSCSSRGRPRPDVEWFKDGEPFFPRTDRIEMKKGNLNFHDLMLMDRGNYTCVAMNVVGQVAFTYILDVIEKVWPLMVVGPNNITVNEGEDAEFFCQATNDPRARISWLKKSDDGDRPTYLQGVPGTPEVLLILNVTQSHAGQYTCMAGNYYGSKYQDAWLVVLLPTTTTSTTTTTTVPTTPTTTTTTTTSTTTSTTTTTPTTTPSTTTTTMEPPPPPIPEKKKKKDKDRKRKKDKKDRKRKKDKKNRNKGNGNSVPVFDETLDESQTDGSFHNSFPDLFPDNGYGINYNPDMDLETYTDGPWEGYTDDPMLYTEVDIDDSDNQLDDPAYIGDSNTNKKGKASKEGSSTGISVWTVYIIVGSVAGGILLTGLIAIAVALCCQKEEDSQYKSTSV